MPCLEERLANHKKLRVIRGYYRVTTLWLALASLAIYSLGWGTTMAWFTSSQSLSPVSITAGYAPVASNVLITHNTQALDERDVLVVGMQLGSRQNISDADNDPLGTPIFEWYWVDGNQWRLIPPDRYVSGELLLTEEDRGKFIGLKVIPTATSGYLVGSPTSANRVMGPVNMLYALSISAEGGEVSIIEPSAGTFKDTGDYLEGSVITLQATPDVGYTLEGWIINAAHTTDNLTATINMNGDVRDVTVTAKFSRLVSALTIEIDGEGTVDPPEGAYTYPWGDKVTMHATAEEGWEFVEWRLSQGDPIQSTPYVHEMAGNVTFTAVFQAQKPEGPLGLETTDQGDDYKTECQHSQALGDEDENDGTGTAPVLEILAPSDRRNDGEPTEDLPPDCTEDDSQG